MLYGKTSKLWRKWKTFLTVTTILSPLTSENKLKNEKDILICMSTFQTNSMEGYWGFVLHYWLHFWKCILTANLKAMTLKKKKISSNIFLLLSGVSLLIIGFCSKMYYYRNVYRMLFWKTSSYFEVNTKVFFLCKSVCNRIYFFQMLFTLLMLCCSYLVNNYTFSVQSTNRVFSNVC